MVRSFRDYTSCDCILLPVFFHTVTTHKATYDSSCVGFSPYYSCPGHRVTTISRSPGPKLGSLSDLLVRPLESDSDFKVPRLPSPPI